LGSKDTVTSPTFTLSKIYKAKGAEVHHYDFYRLHEAGIMSDELAESLQDPKAITVVEWSGVVQNVLPDERLSIDFKMAADNSDERQIVVSYTDSRAELIRRLETAWQELRP